MKKRLLVIAGLVLLSNISQAAMNCPTDAGGTLITGKDGTTKYCISKSRMSWWNANLWCQAIGGKLITLDECNKIPGTGGNCPQLAGGVLPHYVWVQNVSKNSNAYHINPAGVIIDIPRHGYDNIDALCKD